MIEAPLLPPFQDTPSPVLQHRISTPGPPRLQFAIRKHATGQRPVDRLAPRRSSSPLPLHCHCKTQNYNRRPGFLGWGERGVWGFAGRWSLGATRVAGRLAPLGLGLGLPCRRTFVYQQSWPPPRCRPSFGFVLATAPGLILRIRCMFGSPHRGTSFSAGSSLHPADAHVLRLSQ